jgi:hypothetical protein
VGPGLPFPAGQRSPARSLLGILLWILLPLAARADTDLAHATDPAGGGKAARSSRKTTDKWWKCPSTPEGMITAGWTYADGTVPETQGLRLAYGPFGVSDEFCGWGEFFLTVRNGEGNRVTAAGASYLPFSFQHKRLGWGPVFTAGLEQRKAGDSLVLAGLIGFGPELVVRLFRRWDFAATGEIDYVTTLDSEFQVRLGFRYHHPRISAW